MSNRRDSQRQNEQETRQDARAPYNFVPLPERAVDVREQPGVTTLDDALPSHNVFRSDRRHGYFDVTLTTESPLYIRGMLTRDEAENKETHRNKPDFFHTGDPAAPVVPGSSLRGMIRALVEIVTWSKLTRVSNSPKIFYRAVAAEKDDPLGEDYKVIVGKPGKLNVRAGYLEREGDQWFIRPATLYKNQAFIKVKALKEDKRTKEIVQHEDVQAVQGLIPLNSSEYRVQYHPVVSVGDFRPLKPTGYAIAVRSPKPGESSTGILVCTGNMAESSDEQQGRVKTNRRNFALVLPPDPNARRLQIAPQAITDYRDGLTAFQQESPFDPQYGCLVEGRPIFYIPPTQGRMVQYFGHAPFSRIPASLTDKSNRRAVTPGDLVPDFLREHPNHIDFGEAIFGYVRSAEVIQLLEQEAGKVPQGDPRRAYAGRISISDARMCTETDNPYDIDAGGITPPILGSPKPTTFQHYLNQRDENGTVLDRKNLRHYDTKAGQGNPAAQIRGHKLYWRQRRAAVSEIPGSTTEPLESLKDKAQRTRIRPVKKGIKFTFRVDFENMTDIELGALAWVLALGNESHHPNARHMLGMGKPFGMGVVKLDAALVLRDRQRRYTSLFDSGWSSGDENGDAGTFISHFNTFIEGVVGQEAYQKRMKELLPMLEGREPNPLFTYMRLEPQNEYKDRPVLPYPTEIIPSPEMLAQREQERLRQEIERQKAEKRARGIEVGDVIRGKVAEKPKYDDEDVVIDRLNVSDGRKYVAYFMAQHRRREEQIQKDQDITLFVLEVEQSDDGYTYLWCRRATKEERQK